MSRIADVLGKPTGPQYMGLNPVSHAVKVALRRPVYVLVRYPIGANEFALSHQRIA